MTTPMTRDMDTLGDDGPELVRYETPYARDIYGQKQAEADRPQFSPVAQPGMREEIWFHTVKGDTGDKVKMRKAPRPPRGIFARLHEEKGDGNGSG
jgi:hypothetical protein